jgi:hypothetical protein
MTLNLSGSTGVSGVDGSAGTPAFQGTDSNTGISFGTDVIIGSTGGSERFRCDASGRLLVGTSSARANFFNSTISPGLQVEAAGNDGSPNRFASITYGDSSTSGPIFVLGKHRGTTVGSTTVVNSGDEIGRIAFQGSDGTEFVEGAQIRAEVDSTPGANDMPGRLVFSTTADGASSPTERMRINNEGSVLINTTSTNLSANERLTVNGISTFYRGSGIAAYFQRTVSNGDVISFRRDATEVGTISVTTTATAYNTSSDYRLKENIVNLDGAIDRLKQLPVHRFNFIADPDTVVDGFIAHEAAEVVPECVTGAKDEMDDDGNPVYQGIDQSKLVPLLTAALQEAIAKIETLEARLTAAGIA